jgi:hypothetical protein
MAQNRRDDTDAGLLSVGWSAGLSIPFCGDLKGHDRTGLVPVCNTGVALLLGVLVAVPSTC